MAVYKHRYKAYDGYLTPEWTRFLILPRYAYREVFKSKFFLMFFILCFIPTIGASVIIYLKHNVKALEMLQLPVQELFPIDATFFFTMLTIQGWFAFLLMVYVGPGLVSPDLSNNALPLYLSRPFSKVDYVLGKGSVLFILLSAVTWAPLIFLYLLQSTLEGPGWMFSNLSLAVASILGSVIWVLVLSLLALAVSAWVRWKAIAGAALFGSFFVAAGFGEVINEVFFTKWGDLINLKHLIDTVWNWLFFGTTTAQVMPTAHVPLWTAWGALSAACGFCLLLLARKIKAYEVVR